jgi:hypothetical protein
VVKLVDTPTLLTLEHQADDLGFSQRLHPEWLERHIDPVGLHYLCPALWHDLGHRPDVSPQLRCQVLITMRNGRPALSLLDLAVAVYVAPPGDLERNAAGKIHAKTNCALPVREWDDLYGDA